LTTYLENLFSNISAEFHSNPSIRYGDIASRERGTNGQRTDRQTDRQPENIMFSTHYYWRRHTKLAVCLSFSSGFKHQNNITLEKKTTKGKCHTKTKRSGSARLCHMVGIHRRWYITPRTSTAQSAVRGDRRLYMEGLTDIYVVARRTVAASACRNNRIPRPESFLHAKHFP